MDRRKEPRFACTQPATISSLGDEEKTLAGAVVDLSGRGAKLRLPEPLPVNTSIRIDFLNTLLLGDVCYCRSEQGAFTVGVTLAHSISETASLLQLMEKLKADTLSETPEDDPSRTAGKSSVK